MSKQCFQNLFSSITVDLFLWLLILLPKVIGTLVVIAKVFDNCQEVIFPYSNQLSI